MGKNKPIIGIAGAIGSGKSTVAAEFARLGCALIDADKLVHEVLDDENTIKQLTGAFGEGIVGTDGQIDRKKLAQTAFKSAVQVKKLNGIVHPPVIKMCEKLILAYKARKNVPAIVLDMPLLVEIGWEKQCDIVVFVACNAKNRLKRAGQMDLETKNNLKKREKFQISLDKKANIADYIVDNNSGESAIAEQIERIFSIIYP